MIRIDETDAIGACAQPAAHGCYGCSLPRPCLNFIYTHCGQFYLITGIYDYMQATARGRLALTSAVLIIITGYRSQVNHVQAAGDMWAAVKSADCKCEVKPLTITGTYDYMQATGCGGGAVTADK